VQETNLIDINELARRLSIAKGTLYNWVYLRRIPFVKLGRALRFNPEEIERIVRSSSTLEVAGRRVREVSPATSNREMALLKHMFNLAERWGQHQGTNPVRLVKFLPEDNLRVETVTEAEEQRLLLASPPYLRDMILFAINTGLRTSDIFNLEWTEVDIEQRRLKKILVLHRWPENGDGKFRGRFGRIRRHSVEVHAETKKNQRPLSLPLNDTAFGIVEARRGIHHGPYVFYNPMTGDKFKDVKGAIAAAVKRAGLGKITWHMFRHTFASRLTREGVDIVTVKELLGHSNISTTMRYAHSNDDAKRGAVHEGRTRGDDQARESAGVARGKLTYGANWVRPY
jgi:excisionase family DNA binding protein